MSFSALILVFLVPIILWAVYALIVLKLIRRTERKLEQLRGDS